MLCPFNRGTTRLPSGQANGQAFAVQTTAWPTMKKTNTIPSRRFR